MENKIRIKSCLLLLIICLILLLITIWYRLGNTNETISTESSTERVTEEIITEEIITEETIIEEVSEIEETPTEIIEEIVVEEPEPVYQESPIEVESEKEESEVVAIDSELPEIEEETETEVIEDDTTHYIPIPEEWNLIVVNKWNPIPENYTVELTELFNGKKVDSRISESLQEMFDAASAVGISLIVSEGYRTSEEQQLMFDEKVQSYISQGYSSAFAEKKAKEWVAIPGTSEHELGLAVDINAEQMGGYNSTAYSWLADNAYKYGFILRYPSGKKDITGIQHEPWHYRYVGVEVAQEIFESGLCLEEYLQSR